MGGIPQHNITEPAGGPGCVDFAPISLFGQQGQVAAVVNMGVGQQNTVDFARSHRQGLVFVDILSLLHAAVNQEMQPTCLKQGAAARYFVVCT